MLALISSVRSTIAAIDLSVTGGVLLLIDMILFAALAAFWERAGRIRLRTSKKSELPRRR